WWASAMGWVGAIAAAGLPPLLLYLSLYAGVFFVLARRAARAFGPVAGVAVLPVLWCGVELLRGEIVFDGFAWYYLGHPFIEGGSIASWPGRIGGVWLVSFLSACCSTAVVGVLLGTRRLEWVGVLACVLAGWLVPGVLVYRGAPAAPGAAGPEDGSKEVAGLRIGVVQTNVPQHTKGSWDPEERVARLLEFLDATSSAAQFPSTEPSAVVLWPESMFPGIGLEPDAIGAAQAKNVVWWIEGMGEGENPVTPLPVWLLAEELLAFQAGLGVPLLIGATAFERPVYVDVLPDGGAGDSEPGLELQDEGRFNSVIRIESGATRERYDKLRLTPFGEVMPYISLIEPLEQALAAFGPRNMKFNLAAGDASTTFDIETPAGDIARIITPICFEITDTRVCRRLVRAGVEAGGNIILANVTNDAWFGAWPGARRDHLLMARWRCVEFDAPLVRAANSGISGFVDRWGMPRGLAPEREAAVLRSVVEPGTGATPYAQWGWMMRWICLGLAAVVATGAFLRRTPQNPHEHPAADAVPADSGAARDDLPKSA
ncbi:MAG: apolipoprotein N-acyltransferase, partial [Planctomycetota bacterium]